MKVFFLSKHSSHFILKPGNNKSSKMSVLLLLCEYLYDPTGAYGDTSVTNTMNFLNYFLSI